MVGWAFTIHAVEVNASVAAGAFDQDAASELAVELGLPVPPVTPARIHELIDHLIFMRAGPSDKSSGPGSKGIGHRLATSRASRRPCHFFGVKICCVNW